MIAQSAAQRLLDRLIELGIRIECRGDQLRLTPAAAISTELLRQLKCQKQELLAILQNPASPADGTVPCGVCRREHWIDEPPRNGRIRTRCGQCGRFVGFRREGGN
jgi:hypothetical protein